MSRSQGGEAILSSKFTVYGIRVGHHIAATVGRVKCGIPISPDDTLGLMYVFIRDGFIDVAVYAVSELVVGGADVRCGEVRGWAIFGGYGHTGIVSA